MRKKKESVRKEQAQKGPGGQAEMSELLAGMCMLIEKTVQKEERQKREREKQTDG